MLARVTSYLSRSSPDRGRGHDKADALPARPNLEFLKKRSLKAAHRFRAARKCDRLVLEVIRVEWRRILWRRWTSAL
jgi:hypothetical protein